MPFTRGNKAESFSLARMSPSARALCCTWRETRSEALLGLKAAEGESCSFMSDFPPSGLPSFPLLLLFLGCPSNSNGAKLGPRGGIQKARVMGKIRERVRIEGRIQDFSLVKPRFLLNADTLYEGKMPKGESGNGRCEA